MTEQIDDKEDETMKRMNLEQLENVSGGIIIVPHGMDARVPGNDDNNFLVESITEENLTILEQMEMTAKRRYAPSGIA